MSKKQYECFKCHQVIFFHEGQTNKWGKPQQFNADGTEHWTTCTAREHERAQRPIGPTANPGGKVYYSQERRPPVPQPNVDKGIELQLGVVADTLKSLTDRLTAIENTLQGIVKGQGQQQQQQPANTTVAHHSTNTSIEGVQEYTPETEEYKEGQY